MAISNIHHVTTEEMIRTQVKSIHDQDNRNQAHNTEHLKNQEHLNKEPMPQVFDDSMNEQEMHDAIDKMNSTIQIFNKRMKLSVHEESKRIIVKIIDGRTDKVIREMPAKEVLNFITKLHESIGVLIDKKR